MKTLAASLLALSLLLTASPRLLAQAATGGLTAPSVTADAIVGRWKVGRTIWVLKENGEAHRSRPNFHEDGTWKLISNATPAGYEFNWSGGREIQELHLSTDHNKLIGKNHKHGMQPIGERATTE